MSPVSTAVLCTYGTYEFRREVGIQSCWVACHFPSATDVNDVMCLQKTAGDVTWMYKLGKSNLFKSKLELLFTPPSIACLGSRQNG